MIRIIRGIISRVINAAGKLPRLNFGGLSGETVDGVELFGQYGFSSAPKSGAECVSIKINGQYIVVATADRRYEIPLNNGDAAIHTSANEFVKVLGNGGVEINSTKEINIVSDSEVTVRGSKINLGSGGVLNALVDTRIIYWLHSHTHSAPGGTTGVPLLPIERSDLVSTSIVKGL